MEGEFDLGAFQAQIEKELFDKGVMPQASPGQAVALLLRAQEGPNPN